MRPILIPALAVMLAGFGCGETSPSQPAATLSPEGQEAEAKRVFDIAQGLEKEKKTQDAAAAYRHIVRQFPNTPQSKKARARIKKLPQR